MLKMCKILVIMPLILNIIAIKSTRSLVIKTSSILNASRAAIRDLAENLADELVDEGVKACSLHIIDKAVTNYEPPPQVEVLCHALSSAVVTVEKSKFKQLVVLVPEAPNAFIEYEIIKPNETTKTFLLQKQQYQIFSTVLGPQCHHGLWGHGPILKNKLKHQPPTSNLNIEVKRISDFEYSYVNDNMATVSASFTWNPVFDECTYSILNSCASKSQNDFDEKRFTLNGEIKVTFENIPLGDECMVSVFGTQQKGSLQYLTPKCSPFNISQPCVPEKPANVVIITEESDSGEGWNIIVKWSKPEYAPINYTLLLYHDRIQKINVPGSATQAIFHNVEYSTNLTFNIKISAKYPLSEEVVNRLGMFPLRSQAWSGGIASSGAWAGALILAAAAAAVSCARVKIREKRIKLYFPEEKGEKEAIEPSAGQDTNRTTSDSWEMPPERLQLLQVLGEGAFGIVRKGTLTPGTKEVAVKMLKEFPSVEEVRSFRAEMDLMKSVGGHPHVVSLVGCCSGRRPCIIAEYCSRGDLLNYLRCAWDVRMSRRNAKYYNNNIEFGAEHLDELVKSKHPKLYINKMYDLQGVCDEELTAVDLISFCRQIAMGMEFLASNRVVHRDLAARNILVCGDKTLKIADFGLSRDVYQDNQYTQKGNCKLPVKWMAIESLVHRLYTTQSDVWSFGVVMWEVVTVGGSPYPGLAAARLPRLLRLGYRMPKPNNCAQQLYEIMLSCWSGRPRERPTFSDLRSELDTLLHGEAADYLTLEVDYEDRPTPCKLRSFFNRNKLSLWPLHKMEYERQKSTSNHYTFTPKGRTQVV